MNALRIQRRKDGSLRTCAKLDVTQGCGKRVGGKASTSDIVLKEEIIVKISGPSEVMVKIARKINTIRCHQLNCRPGRAPLGASKGPAAACAEVDTCAMSLLPPYRLLVLGSIKRR